MLVEFRASHLQPWPRSPLTSAEQTPRSDVGRSSEFRRRLTVATDRANIAVSNVTLAQLEAYYGLLARWNHTINLTGFELDRLSDAALGRLFVEPLAAARYFPEGPISWVDIGSGGGSPAIPV